MKDRLERKHMQNKILDFLFGKDRKAAGESIFWNLLKIIGIVSIFVLVYGIVSIVNAIIGA